MKKVKNLLLQDKKGVSLMIGYVLLIIIAVSLSIAVFTFLKLYVPPGSPECPKEVKLTIEDYSCEENPPSSGEYEINLTLANKGLFRIYGVYIKLGQPGRIYKTLINTGEHLGEPWGDLMFTGLDSEGEVLLGYLNPGAITVKPSSDLTNTHYIYGSGDYESGFIGGVREIEIEPIYLGEENDNQASVCETAIVREKINCQ